MTFPWGMPMIRWTSSKVHSNSWMPWLATTQETLGGVNISQTTSSANLDPTKVIQYNPLIGSLISVSYPSIGFFPLITLFHGTVLCLRSHMLCLNTGDASTSPQCPNLFQNVDQYLAQTIVHLRFLSAYIWYLTICRVHINDSLVTKYQKLGCNLENHY
jgi:hypothetical protein